MVKVNPFKPKRQILDFSKLKESADDNFEFVKIARKFSKRVENTAGKGEIDRYEQFLLSHSVFKRLTLQTRKKQGLFGKRLMGENTNTFFQKSLRLSWEKYKRKTT